MENVKYTDIRIEQESWGDTLEKFAPLHLLSIPAGLALAGYAAYIAQYPSILPLISVLGVGAISMLTSRGSKRSAYESIGVKNEEGARYFVHVGNIVKRIYGDTKRTADPANAEYPVLLNYTQHSTHYAIMGTTGSGKTVTMQNLMEEILESGGGFVFVDGKGSLSMIRTIYALALKYNRERDFQIVNFANPKLSDTLDFFSLEIDDIVNILRMLLEDKTTKSPEWAQYGEGIAVNLARIFKYLDDKGEFFTTEEMDEILLKGKREKLGRSRLTFREYFKFFAHDKAFKLLHTLKLLNTDKDVWQAFEDFFISASKCTYNDIYDDPKVGEGESIGQMNLLQRIEKKYTQNRKDIKQFDYAWSVGVGYWSEARDKILSEYKEIFDLKEGEAGAVNIGHTIGLHKILYYVLPGTAATSNVRFASNILFANIRSYYEVLKEGRTLTIPYTIFLDEMNSWAHTVEGIGALMSQSREQRLAFVCGFQTDLKLDDKGREASMIWGNANTKIVLKTDDPQLLEYINKNFDEQELARSDENEPDRVKTEKRAKFLKDEIRKLRAGESYIIRGEHIAPFVSKYRPPVIYRPAEKGLPPTDNYELPPI